MRNSVMARQRRDVVAAVSAGSDAHGIWSSPFRDWITRRCARPTRVELVWRCPDVTETSMASGYAPAIRSTWHAAEQSLNEVIVRIWLWRRSMPNLTAVSSLLRVRPAALRNR